MEKTRDQIDEKYKWDLEGLYKTKEEIDKDIEKHNTLAKKIVEYKGKITKDAKTLYEFLELDSQINQIYEKLIVYAMCKSDEDTGNSDNRATLNRIYNVGEIYDEQTNFVTPELLKTPYETIEKYIEEYEPLKEYAFDLKQIYRYQKYVLDEDKELLVNYMADLARRYQTNYTIANNSLIDLGTIKDEEGKEVKLSNGTYRKYISSPDRNVRKAAKIAREKAYAKFSELFSVDYEGTIKAGCQVAKLRGYNSAIEMYLYPDGVTEKMYNNLLTIAQNNINVLHKYYKLIKEVLKVDKLYSYDLSAPLVKKSDKKFTPETARKLITEALSIYGKDYLATLNKAFDEKWIDFYPNKNKRVGFYEINCYDYHPLVLANYNDDFYSVSSIAHELGHAMHSYNSAKNNPYHQSDYTLFVAEVASLTNEMVLANHIIKTSKDKQLKLEAIYSIMDVFSDNFFGTLTAGSIFENEVFEKGFKNETLSKNDFNEIYKKIVEKQNGDEVELLENHEHLWSGIPHFYTPFYYYKYSIGICCACYISKRILSGDKQYLEKYLNFLKLGNSMMPLDELKTIDIDLNNTKTIEEGISYFNEMIDEFRKIYNEE